MSHEEAEKEFSVEQYLLGELVGKDRDEFEDHLFDCTICAAEVKQTVMMLDEARRQVKQEAAPVTLPAAGSEQPAELPSKGKVVSIKTYRPWPLAIAAGLLLVIGYQSLIVMPRMRQQIAEATEPAVVQELVLAGAGARGGPATMEVRLRRHASLLLSVDVPSAAIYQKYVCSLASREGKLLWRLELASDEVKDAVPIRVPAEQTYEGDNLLTVEGVPVPGPDGSASPVELARYRFHVTFEQ